MLFVWTLACPLPASAGSCICITCAFNEKLENFRAFSESMAPTLDTGDCAVMRHIDPSDESFKRGDVVGFQSQSDGAFTYFASSP